MRRVTIFHQAKALPMAHSSSMVRHLVSIADLSGRELRELVSAAAKAKENIRRGDYSGARPLAGQVVSLLFSKRSTRTRISTEGAAAFLGAQPLFLSRDDIQLGVNESFYDTTRVVSSMTSAIVARVGPHSEIQALCKDSSVPVINALCEKFHPFQAVADMLTIQEAFAERKEGLKGLNVAWVGDANNVLHDLALACVKLGINVRAATPIQYPVDEEIKTLIAEHNDTGASVEYYTNPKDAVKNADIIVTDTWISMGQEDEKAQKLQEFAGYQVTNEMAAEANNGWKFMHCLPRHNEEVDDEVFYSDRSLVFEEAENRLYAAIAVLDAFVVKKGKIL